MNALQKIWNGFLNVLFPSVCVNCGLRGKTLICENCFSNIEINNSFFCPKCNRRLPADADLPKTANLCHPEEKFFLAAAASYQDKAVRELVHALKYNRAKIALESFGEIVKRYSEKVFRSPLEIENFTMIPIPLHPRKERERGFNQAELLAGIMNKELRIKVQEDNLIKIKNTDSQTEAKDYEERERNVSGVFAVEKPEEIAGRNIVLVDDVFTSGATMKEAVHVLKQVGARKIIGFVIAKT